MVRLSPEVGGELSLRHLPDASDASFSFQIPTTTRGEYLLADDDEDDFFKGAEDFLTTPAPPPRFALDPLTLSQLTPRPSGAGAGNIESPSSPQNQPRRSSVVVAKEARTIAHTPKPQRSAPTVAARPKHTAITRVATQTQIFTNPGSPAAERIENLRAEVNSLTGSVNDNRVVSIETAGPEALGPSSKSHRQQPKDSQTLRREKGTAKRTLIAGGITKAGKQRGSPSSVACEAAAAFIQLGGRQSREHAPIRDLNGAEAASPDSSVGSDALGGAAARLLMYNQSVLNTYGPISEEKLSKTRSNSTPDPLPEPHMNAGTGTSWAAAPQQPSSSSSGGDDNDKPLTISQLSPHKLPSDVPISLKHDSHLELVPKPPPSRSSSKRPASSSSSNPSEEGRARKKGKFNVLPIATGQDSTSLAHAQSAEKPPTRKPIRRRASGSRCRPPKVVVGPSSVKTRAALAKKQQTGAAVMMMMVSPVNNNNPSGEREPRSRKDKRDPAMSTTGFTVNSTSSTSRTTSDHLLKPQIRNSSSKIRSAAPPVASSSHRPLGHAASGSTSGSTSVKKNAAGAATGAMHATIPIAFNFSVDARLAARKGEVTVADNNNNNNNKKSVNELRKSHKTHITHSIPDFRALHAAYEAELAHRKENIHPVVPVSPQFETELRLEERRKFDERVREREREMRMEQEERRREREVREEQEVREMRKRSVPRAHEVPEWYRDAPKRVKS